MTTTTVDEPTVDELVAIALERLYWAKKGLDKPLTPSRIHAVKQHLTVLELTLRTPPLRPKGMA